MISEHVTEWLGFPVRLFKDPDDRPVEKTHTDENGGVVTIYKEDTGDGEDAEAESQAPPLDYTGTVYRLTSNWDSEEPIPELLEEFLENPASARTTALIIGLFNTDSESSEETVQALVAARSRLPELTALFLGDIIGEENEMSWITHGDVTPLLTAYPALEHFRVRGTDGLSFGSGIDHAALKTLTVESGGLPRGVLGQIARSSLPELESLELWLGTPGYGGDATAADLEPFLDGSRWPKLKRLALRNCEWADALAAALQDAPVLARLEELDLSLGALGDEGAEALLRNDGLKHLRKLDLHHHYLSDGMIARVQEAFPQADLSEAEGEADPDERYISVSE